jgi:hypothetical protein
MPSILVDMKSGQTDSHSGISEEKKRKKSTVKSIVYYITQVLLSNKPQDTFVLELSRRGYQMFCFPGNKARQNIPNEENAHHCPFLIFHKASSFTGFRRYSSASNLKQQKD